MYGNHVQDYPQEGCVTCYLGNPHRYNYEEHSHMLPIGNGACPWYLHKIERVLGMAQTRKGGYTVKLQVKTQLPSLNLFHNKGIDGALYNYFWLLENIYRCGPWLDDLQ